MLFIRRTAPWVQPPSTRLFVACSQLQSKRVENLLISLLRCQEGDKASSFLAIDLEI